MLWFYIMSIVVALFVILCITRLGMQIIFGDFVKVNVTFGFLRFQIAPSRSPKEENETKPEEKTRKDWKKTSKKIPKPTKEDLKAAYDMLWSPAKNSLKKFGRGLRLDPLTLAVTIPGLNDPALAAQTYGVACAAIWTVMPALEEMIDIPRPSVHLGLNYEAQKYEVQGEMGISIPLGTLFAIGFGMAIPTVRWIIRFLKAHRKPEKETQHKDENPAVVA